MSEGRQIETLERSVHHGLPSIESEQVGHIEFEFLVDQDIAPTSIHSFAARWVVRDETGGVYRNLTAFQAGGYYGYGYWGYQYYPYWPDWHYGYWGYWRP